MFWHGSALSEIRRLPLEQMVYQFVGDQNLIRMWLKSQQRGWVKVQDQELGVYSYKVHCENGLPKDARVVCFHGKPYIQDVKDEWVKENWR